MFGVVFLIEGMVILGAVLAVVVYFAFFNKKEVDKRLDSEGDPKALPVEESEPAVSEPEPRAEPDPEPEQEDSRSIFWRGLQKSRDALAAGLGKIFGGEIQN